MTYKTDNNQDNLGLELLHYQNKDILYLVVKHYQLINEVEQNLEVLIDTGESSRSFKAIRREGGQKLLLSDEAKDFALENLLKGKPVSFKIGSYSLKADGEGFKKHYKKSFLDSIFPF